MYKICTYCLEWILWNKYRYILPIFHAYSSVKCGIFDVGSKLAKSVLEPARELLALSPLLGQKG